MLPLQEVKGESGSIVTSKLNKLKKKVLKKGKKKEKEGQQMNGGGGDGRASLNGAGKLHESLLSLLLAG